VLYYGKPYISAIEAAEKWNVSYRRVLQYCERGKIQGADKIGKTWMIPDSVDKPEDGRCRGIRMNKCTTLSIPILIDERIWLEELIDREGNNCSIAMQAQRERAFFQGNFEEAVVNCKGKDKADMRPSFSELIFTAHANIILGRKDEAERSASEIFYRRGSRFPEEPRRLFEMGVASVSHYLYGNKRIANWISSANFDKVEEQAKPFALFMYATNLQNRGKYERAAEAAGMAKHFFDVDERPAVGSLLLMLQAQALKRCGRESDGLTAVMKAAELGAKHELYYPLALFSEPDSMADEYFQNKIPEAYDKIAEIRSKIDNITLYDYTYSW